MWKLLRKMSTVWFFFGHPLYLSRYRYAFLPQDFPFISPKMSFPLPFISLFCSSRIYIYISRCRVTTPSHYDTTLLPLLRCSSLFFLCLFLPQDLSFITPKMCFLSFSGTFLFSYNNYLYTYYMYM